MCAGYNAHIVGLHVLVHVGTRLQVMYMYDIQLSELFLRIMPRALSMLTKLYINVECTYYTEVKSV